MTSIKRTCLMVGVVGKGRDPIGRVIPVRFTPHTRAQLERLAAERHAKLSEVIRDLVDQALEGRAP